MKKTVFISREYAIKVTPITYGLSFQITAAVNDLRLTPLLNWNVNIKYQDPEPEKTLGFSDEGGDINSVHDERQWKIPTENDILSISFVADTVKYHSLVSSKEIYGTILWATLFWYFHQDPPNIRLNTQASSKIPYNGRPKGNWKVGISCSGILRNERLLLYVEQSRLIANEASNSYFSRSSNFFTTRCAFWQLDASIYLTLLSVMAGASETGCLSTYTPPIPLQHVISNGIRHPLRPLPPPQGERFYSRFINSLEQVLSFRVASRLSQANLSNDEIKQPPFVEQNPEGNLFNNMALSRGPSDKAVNDLALLNKWMNEPRVAKFWGVDGSPETQDKFLATALASKHSFPIIGYWDEKPFGYFEIYWVKEDILGQHLGNEADYWDRGIHCLVGEQEFRGLHRVRAWLSALVHYCFIADNRTQAVMLEPRVDNEKLVSTRSYKPYILNFDSQLNHKQTCNLPHRERLSSRTRN